MDKEAIKHRAYEIWESEGRPHGRDAEHWRKAETMIANGSAGKTGQAKVGASKSPKPGKTGAPKAASATTTKTAKAASSTMPAAKNGKSPSKGSSLS